MPALDFAVMMDIVDPAARHWTSFTDHADAEIRKHVRALAQRIARSEGWEVAEPISRWRIWLLTQAQLAEALGVSERHIQNLEASGLPNEGHRATKVYPWPDALAWREAQLYSLGEYEHVASRDSRLMRGTRLTVERARAEYLRGRVAEWINDGDQ
jgi:hypothetical protein